MSFEHFANIVNSADSTIVKIAQKIVANEGGYVDHPNDPGGATNRGVSLRYARERGTIFDLDNDGDVDADDIRIVTKEVAVGAFIDDFYIRPRFNQLPTNIVANVFDMGVNAGTKTAVNILQRTLVRLGYAVTIDGIMGPKTLAAANAAANRYTKSQLNRAYSDERIAYYKRLVVSNSKYSVFLKGWTARANEMANY